MSGLAKMNLSKLIGCPDTRMLFYFHTTRDGGEGGRRECVCADWGWVMRGGRGKRKALKSQERKLARTVVEEKEKERCNCCINLSLMGAST